MADSVEKNSGAERPSMDAAGQYADLGHENPHDAYVAANPGVDTSGFVDDPDKARFEAAGQDILESSIKTDESNAAIRRGMAADATTEGRTADADNALHRAATSEAHAQRTRESIPGDTDKSGEFYDKAHRNDEVDEAA